MFKYYKKQFVSLLRSELVKSTECIVPKTEKGQKLQEALKNWELTKDELNNLRIEFLKEENREAVEKTKKEKSDLIKCSLETWIKIENSNIRNSLELLTFLKTLSWFNNNENNIKLIKENVGKKLLITWFNWAITVTPASDAKIESDDDENNIETNSTENINKNKDFTEANDWYKNSKNKPNYTAWDKQVLKARFWIENIENWLNEEQFNKIVEFQRDNSLKWDWKIWKETLEKIKVNGQIDKVNTDKIYIITPEKSEKENREFNNLLEKLLKKDKLSIIDFNRLKDNDWFLWYIRFKEEKVNYKGNEKIQRLLNIYNNTEINNKLLNVYNKLKSDANVRADSTFTDLENFLKKKGLLIEKINSQPIVKVNQNQQQKQYNTNNSETEAQGWTQNLSEITSYEKNDTVKKFEEAWQSFDKTTEKFNEMEKTYKEINKKIDDYINQKSKIKKKITKK